MTPRVYRGRILHCFNYNNLAYAECKMHAQLPGVKPTDVPDWCATYENTHTHTHTHMYTHTKENTFSLYTPINMHRLDNLKIIQLLLKWYMVYRTLLKKGYHGGTLNINGCSCQMKRMCLFRRAHKSDMAKPVFKALRPSSSPIIQQDPWVFYDLHPWDMGCVLKESGELFGFFIRKTIQSFCN